MKALALLLALLLAPVVANAFTCSATGCTFTLSYTEPTTNIAGGPANLTSTTAFYTIGGTEKSIVTPASSANGGGVITKQITEPILPGQVVTISNASALATNPAGPSARSAPPVALTINRSGEVVDNPPSGVTIQ